MAARIRPTILCTWEVGGELGHISRLSAIAKVLAAAGYRVVVALKDLSRAYPFFAGTEVALMQAPVWLPKISMQRPVACQADAMLLLGYLEPDPLDCLVQAWKSLADQVKPDAVIFDYSPTAMLAMRRLAIPKFIVGNGFADPVPGRAIADWRPHTTDDGLIDRQEKRVLAVINQVLQRHHEPPLAYLADLFYADQVLVANLRELDVYQNRPNAVFCLKTDSTVGEDVSLPPGDRPRIVAYLKPAYPQFAVLLAALARCDAQVLVVCPRGPEDVLRKHAGPFLHFTTEVVNLPAALAQAELFVGHGNGGTVRESVVAGTPLAVLPIQLEQLLTGQKIQQLGIGRLVERVTGEDELVRELNQLLAERETYRQAIERLLASYPLPLISVEKAVLAALGELLPAQAQ